MTTTTTRPCWHCGTPHESDTVPALCSDPCRDVWRGLYQLAYAEPSEILDGPIHPNEVRTVVSAADQGRRMSPDLVITDEAGGRHHFAMPRHTNHGCNLEPAQHQGEEDELDDPEYLELEQHQIAAAERAERGNRALQAQAPRLVLSLYRAGQLGYLAASDEWVNGNGSPLIEPLQQAATKLALDGQLPEFAEWFPAPSEDNRDFPLPDFSGLGTTVEEAAAGLEALTAAARADGEQFNQEWLDASYAKLAEARPADEPQDLVGAEQAAAARLLPVGMPERAELLGQCPPRPPEPPATFAQPDGPFLARLLGALRRWRP